MFPKITLIFFRDASTIASEVDLVLSNQDSKLVSAAVKCLVQEKEKIFFKTVNPVIRELSARNREKLDMKMVVAAMREKLQERADERKRRNKKS